MQRYGDFTNTTITRKWYFIYHKCGRNKDFMFFRANYCQNGILLLTLLQTCIK